MSQAGKIGSQLAGATDVIVIGAGHAGLATSFLLSKHGVKHVVLERGEVANSWRKERWESLQLLTPNWQTRLPGFQYNGEDPDGYMGMAELIGFIEDYAKQSRAPVRTNTNVTSLSKQGDTYRVVSDRGEWTAKAVVIASGACNIPTVPKVAADVPDYVAQLTPHQYRTPNKIDAGGVLVVGASSSGIQIADELMRAGHRVTMAVGEHVRLPRTYRGKDILHWMDHCGILSERYDEVDDIARGRSLPSMQLVGADDKADLNLNGLIDRGAQITGRLMGVQNGVAQFSGSLRNVCALADLKMNRLLNAIDEAVADEDVAASPERFEATRIADAPILTMNLRDESIRTIVWATGYRPDYSWLDIPVLDRKGRIEHDGGIIGEPGLYVLGLPLMRRRKSSFIFGIEDDATDITNHLVNYLYSRSKTNGLYRNDSCEPGVRRCA